MTTPEVRAADGDRDAAAALVQAAHADGRLDLEELDERLTRVYAARTLPELRSITRDLVAVAHGSDADTLALSSQGFGGDIRRDGRWRVPPHIVADIGHSELRLDFTEAEVQGFEILLELTARSGDVTVIVPEGWSIDLDQLTTKSGEIRNRAVAPLPNGVRLRVTGRTKSGDVVVRHRRRPWWRRGSP